MKQLRGVMPAVTTPFTSDHEVDLDRLVERCAWLLSHGCDGINLLGTTGEGASLSLRQRVAAMRAVAQSSLDLSRFMVSTGAAAFDDSKTLTRTAAELGFEHLLVLPPFYYKGVTEEGVERVFDALIETTSATPARLYLYHIPAFTGFAFTPAMANRMRQRHGDRIAGLKDSTGDLAVADSFVAGVKGFDVFPSAETSLAVARERGYAGCISATVNVTAPYSAQVWAGTRLAASCLQAAGDIRAAMLGPALVSSVKWAVSQLTGDEAWQRVMPPLEAIGENIQQRVQAALDKHRKLGRSLQADAP